MQDQKGRKQDRKTVPLASDPASGAGSNSKKNTGAVQTPPFGDESATLVNNILVESPTTIKPSSANELLTSAEAATAIELVPVSGNGAIGSAAKPPGSWTGILLQPGTVLGNRYQIIEVLGEGGMGAVYKARDRELDRIIALKVIRGELVSNAEILQRFKQELILARQITDRNIIRIFDIGEADGIKFITMEYVEGESLYHMLRERGKLPVPEVVDIMEQVFSGLRAAHREGVIHRDLKPGNIMRDTQGRIVVMDFGLARSMEGDGMTRTGAMLGTMEYMSPEQAQAMEVDARSDIFTVGLICYELLTGKMPFEADSAVASLLRRTRERAVPISEISKEVPIVLSNIISKCLERDPNRRYQTAQAVLDDLRAWQGKDAKTRISASSSGLLLNRMRDLPWKRATTALLALLVIAAATWYVGRRGNVAVTSQHPPVSVLVADFQNNTSDTLFDGALEPMFNVALEGASFINAYSRGNARRLAGKLPNPTSRLDEKAARLIAANEGVAAVVTGSLSRRGDGYRLSIEAIDALSGKPIARADASAANKDEILLSVPKLAAPIRKALGDTTPESVQLEAAGGAFTAASLEAVHDYGVGMEQQFSGNFQGALQSFSKAAELDPNFARAYAGLAAVSRGLGNEEGAKTYIKQAMEHVDRMTQRERYRIRGLYYLQSGDFPKCIDEYSALLKLYPSDNLGHMNLANCYSELRNFPKATEEFQRAVEISPNAAISRMNLSISASYAGDFKTAEQQARAVLQLNPSYETPYFALAYAQLGQGQLDQAAETYEKLKKLSPLGASMGASGLADLALYQGRFSDAVRMLESGAAADLAAKNSRAAEKFAALAYTQLSWGHNRQALEAAKRALSNTKKANVRFLMARILVETGEAATARTLAAGLASELSPEAQADSKLIEGETAFHDKDARKAIQLFTDANKVLDTWMGHFDLGRAYLEAGLYVQADSEFDQCITRGGEALELYDGPTYGYLPPVYYYQGRVREGLKSPGAADSYAKFVSLQNKGDGGPLLQDARKHLVELTRKK